MLYVMIVSPGDIKGVSIAIVLLVLGPNVLQFLVRRSFKQRFQLLIMPNMIVRSTAMTALGRKAHARLA